jgi:chemotaxis family two-component system sensor kinase Cph1
MVYRFDPDGHGKIIAEARDPRLESLLGHHYPATDIPQRARELYLRNRLRVLVDVHYEPPLVPRQLPAARTASEELDMSMCHLRSMSPLHLQYLKNMGVTGTLVVSLVREGRLWGLIACHHYSPRNLRFALRAAADLLAEVIATRIAAIENYAHAQVAIQVRRLEQRLVEATSTEGDWRLALFRNPRTLLQPLEATGAALFQDGEILTAGEVPSTPELRALLQWVDAQQGDGLFSCSSVARANPALDSLTPRPAACWRSSCRSQSRLPDVVPQGTAADRDLGRRPVQAGGRQRPAASCRRAAPSPPGPRSCAAPRCPGPAAIAWPALARAFGVAVRWWTSSCRCRTRCGLLIAEHQLAQIRAAHRRPSSQVVPEPVVIADGHP